MMQYGLKKESAGKVYIAMVKLTVIIEDAKEQVKNETSEKMKKFWEDQLSRLEMSYSCLNHIRESLDDFDFVVLDKSDYDLVSGYLMELNI